MISLLQYLGEWAGHKDVTPEVQRNAGTLIEAVNHLMNEMELDGVIFPYNPKTKSQVSGETYGGFRPKSCPIGAPNSKHKKGLGVDIYDPEGKIDAWCLENEDRLKAHGIWIEHPSKTIHWSHWQCVKYGSYVEGKPRYFFP